MFWKKISLLLPWNRRDRELSLEEELRIHADMAEQEARAQGATPDEARFAARRELGSLLRTRDEVKDVWGFALWDSLKRDGAYSLRTLWHARSFAAVAILSLGIGIGSATAIFSLLNTILLKPLAYPKSEALVNVREIVAGLAATYPTLPANYQHFTYWRDHARSFESLAALETSLVTLTGKQPAQVDAAFVSPNFFSVLGVAPQLGRSFLPEEGQRGHDKVVILTASFWNQRFAADPDIVGKTLTIFDEPYTIAGVLPRDFRFPKNSDLGPLVGLGKNTSLFIPLTGGHADGWNGDYDYVVLGRLKPAVSVTQSVAELDLLQHQIDVDHRLGENLRVTGRLLQDVIATPVRTPLYVLMGAVSLLLIIVCVNLANLVIARSTVRAREFSIRTALGAERSRLVRQVLMETLLLGLAGGVLGWGLAQSAIHALQANELLQIPRLDEVQLDAGVFAFSLCASLLAGFFSGILPALRIARIDSQEFLRAASHTVAGSRQSLRTREFLISCEVAICVVLLVGAGLMVSSLSRLLNVDRGFTAEQALAFEVELPGTRYEKPADQLHFWERALDTLRATPGVRSAAFISKLPLTGESNVNGVELEGQDRDALDSTSHHQILLNVRFASPGYLRTMGIPLIKGRFFEDGDRDRAVTVVSARLAAKLWPHQNPLRKKFSTGSEVGKVEVIGVVKDVHATKLDQEPTLVAYATFWRRPMSFGHIVVRTSGDAKALIPLVRQQLHDIDPAVPPPETTTISQLVFHSLVDRYFQMALAGGFACAALALALIGIYGVVAYHAAQRQSEIAVRLALGASRGDVFQLLLRTGLRPVAIGLVVGLVCSAISARLLKSLLFDVTPHDPETILLVVGLMAFTASCACLIPARHAVTIEPATALRHD